jgi:phosphocarrier protein
MVEREVEIVNKLGLHARAAARLVRLASQFACDIYLSMDGERVNAKSILGILSLAAAHGSKLSLLCEGSDAREACDSIATLIANRFDEAE